MQIHGFNKTTLLDYPGIVAATIFTGACNFRCPYCHNSGLVLDPASQPVISEEEVLSHLKKRVGITKGVCITGGEPTLQQDLREFIIKIKDLGLKVKLDSNGYRPEILEGLLKDDLLDYVAMDIKSSEEGYSKVAGVTVDFSKIRRSIGLLINGSVDYEFRTTVVKEFHDKETLEGIAKIITGAGKYFLQGYIDSESVICPGFHSYTYEELKEFLPIFEGRVKHTEIRGVE